MPTNVHASNANSHQISHSTHAQQKKIWKSPTSYSTQLNATPITILSNTKTQSSRTHG